MNINSYLEIKDTGKYDNGVFAKKAIKKGDFVYQLSGERISEEECWNRINAQQENLSDPLQIGLYEYIDLNEFSRSFNHSCDPNTGIRNESDLYAIKDINVGDEITYDYSTTVGPNISFEEWSMDCLCGSKNCRKIISNILSINSNRIIFYKNNNVIPNYQKNNIKLL